MKSLLRMTSVLMAASLGSACWYESFEKVSLGTDSGDGDGDGGEGGAPGDGDGDGSGGSPVPGRPQPEDDVFFAAQKEDVTGNVLDNDTGDDLRVVDFDDRDSTRPSTIGAVQFNIAEDGTLTYNAAAGFWGQYRASYTVENATGERSTASVSILVTPNQIDLALVEQGHAGFVIEGASGDELGSSLAAAGDVNGDGLDDVLVGAPSAAGGDGRVALLLGAEDLPSTITLGTSEAEQHVQLFLGDGTNDGVGISVAGAGRVNGDTRGDLVIGAPTSMSDNGRAYVIYGSDDFPGPAITLDDAPSYGGVTIRGVGTATDFGTRVGGGGDINGDGSADILVLSPFELRAVYAILEPVNDTITNVSSMVFKGESGVPLKQSIAIVGDIEGDDSRAEVLLANIDEFILLAGKSNEGPDAWPANANVLTADDGVTGGLNPENLAPVSLARLGAFDGAEGTDIAYCDGDATCRIVPSTDPYSLDAGWDIGFGAGTTPRVGGAPPLVEGDLNGDGFEDVVFARNDGAFIVWGRDELPSTSLAINSLSDTQGARVEPAGASDVFGQVAVIGDVNGDGRSDWALAQPTALGGAGRVYILYGY